MTETSPRRPVERWQAKKLFEQVQPMLGYLARLQERMERTGFLPDEKLYRLVVLAADSMHRLSVEVHYLSAPGGVCRPISDQD